MNTTSTTNPDSTEDVIDTPIFTYELDACQWFRVAAQLIKSVQCSLEKSKPPTNIHHFCMELEPETNDALEAFGKTIGQLAFYFTNPTKDDLSCWHQCC